MITYTILVVDDEPLVRKTWARGLRRSLQAHVLEASSVQEAQALFLSERVSVVVTDIQMGLDSGLDLIRWLRARQSFLPILVVSGYLQAVRSEIESYPFVESLEKPTRLHVVCDTVRRLALMVPSWDSLPTPESSDV